MFVKRTYMHGNLMTISSKKQVNYVFTEVKDILWKADFEPGPRGSK